MYYKWATDESYFNQVGCIYSTQGFEFDYMGIIFGEDLVWRKDQWVCNPKKNTDPGIKKGLSPEELTDGLRNVYRVLLSRAMMGTYVFFLDPETQEHVSKLGGV